MENLNTIIQKAITHDSEALSTLVVLMTPLLRKYASKIHFMDFDDSMQELSLTLIECVEYLDPAKNKEQLLKYIQQCIIHKYYSLCKKYLSVPEISALDSDGNSELPDNTIDIFQTIDLFNDLRNYIMDISEKNHTKGCILSLSVFENLSDSEISQIMHLSRQYVNRTKKCLMTEFFKNYK
ncbi:MAG: sigma-70 family RNA polymerase sigma factor [Clostridiales bacterium]|nr:sigma-70 family RNA polymerase sigma factor [Clostridiales bacterium]